MGIWEYKNFLIISLAVGLLSSGFVGLSEEVFADKKGKKNTTKIIHLGYLQLAAHDFFNVNRCLDPEFVPVYPFDDLTLLPDCEIKDSENGKLDLSTVLFNPNGEQCDFKKSLKQKDGCALYDDSDIANGGEIRSIENIMISTAGAEVGEKYLQFVEKHGEKKAYKEILKFYHEQLKKAYEESFDLKFPKAKKGEVTNLHNLALRAGHDFLPAEIKFNGKITSLFLIHPLGEKLDEKEKRQPSSPVDGVFDEVFLGIDFCPSELRGFCIKVDLLLADQSFGGQFELGKDTFDEFMLELEDGKFDKKDQVSKLLDEAFSRGINLK